MTAVVELSDNDAVLENKILRVQVDCSGRQELRHGQQSRAGGGVDSKGRSRPARSTWIAGMRHERMSPLTRPEQQVWAARLLATICTSRGGSRGWS